MKIKLKKKQIKRSLKNSIPKSKTRLKIEL